MKTEEILELDCRDSENAEKLQNALLKIPQIQARAKDDKIIELKLIEKYISLMCRKYSIIINYITPNYIDGQDDIYCVSIKNLRNPNNKFIYATSIYEAVAKSAIRIYSDFKNNLLEVNDWDRIRKELRKY